MRVIRTRSVQPDTSPGMVVAAIALIIVIAQDWLVWWSLLLVLALAPIVNYLLVGRTTREETVIEKDI